MLKTNWHTHTKRCGHAIGTDEEYVLAAIQGGVKTLGFSDHAPYKEPNPGSRMNIEEYGDYKKSIRSLKEKYSDQISIHLGLEVEYYPDQWEELSLYREELDYLILGQHEITYNGISAYHIDKGDDLLDYVKAIEAACEHSLCDYIAHPDVALWRYPGIDGSVKEAAKRIAEISSFYNMPVELNCGSGVLHGPKTYTDGTRYAYPTRLFFGEFAKKGCPVIIGLDIHKPELFLTDKYLDRALSVVEGLNCNIIYDYDLITAAKERKKKFY